MKKTLAYVGLAAFIIAAVVWTWLRSTEHTPDMAKGLYLTCTKADCGRFFVIPWDQTRTWARSPSGEGFRCPKCSAFSGKIAAQCEQCGEWMLASEAAARTSGCPKCDPQPETPEQQPERRSR